MFYAFQKISKLSLIPLLAGVFLILAADCSGMSYLRSAVGAFSYARTAAWHNLSQLRQFQWNKPLFKTAVRNARPAETFFFKMNGEPITEDEHTIMYDIKLRNQFPMCLAYGDGKTVPDDEIAAIQEELDKQLPGVQVMFIPTLMYEKIVISDVDQMPYMSQNRYSDFDREKNRLKHRNRAHYEANALVASYIDRGKTGNANAISRAIKRLKNSNETSVLERDVMMREEEALGRGEFLLFRAVLVLEQEPLGNQSLSFGTSFANSMINDRSASPFWWTLYQGYQPYCVPINKKVYAANKNSLRQMFHIPLFTTVENNFARGQIFHARTKIVSHFLFHEGNYDQLLKTMKNQYVRRFYENDLTIKAQSPEEAEKIHRDIFEYVKKNRILLKTS